MILTEETWGKLCKRCERAAETSEGVGGSSNPKDMAMGQYLYIPFLGDEHPFTSYLSILGFTRYQGFDPSPYGECDKVMSPMWTWRFNYSSWTWYLQKKDHRNFTVMPIGNLHGERIGDVCR